MSLPYHYPTLKELADQQVRFAPKEKKIEQSHRAEQLYRSIDPKGEYSYRFICQGITEFRSDLHPDVRFRGSLLRRDLLLFIEGLFESAQVSVADAGEKVWTIEELSNRFNVASKTISRWRKQGLVARRFLFNGKKRVGFLQSSVEFFQEHHALRVERGAKFSQLTDEEKERIVRIARRFARTNSSATEVAKRIAEHTGRSVETVRYTIKAFDDRNSDIAIFPNRNSPLNEEMKRKIFQEFRQNVSIEQLSEHYRRTRGSIYRVLGQMRARRIADFGLDFVENPDFPNFTDTQERQVLADFPSPVIELPRKKRILIPKRTEPPDFVEIDNPKTPTESGESGLPPYLAGLYKIPLLTAEQEVHLFRKMNYLKYKASCLRNSLNPARPRAYLMDQIEDIYNKAIATKNAIVSANLRLVVSIAKRHIGPYSNFFDLISDGNLVLIRAVEKFDFARGNRFSTYATWAITRSFARTIPVEKRHRDRFQLGDEEMLEATADNRSDSFAMERVQVERELQIDRFLHKLDEREQQIIASRFGIGPSPIPHTLNEVGAEIGVTKERVRQIEARALAKLRKVAEDEDLEIPGL